jgi:AmiR/NasT family two-component response regulator
LLDRENLSRRAEGRRVVVKAILKIMKDHDLSDDEAYREMRVASMARRISIEEFAAQIVASSTSPMRLAGTAAHERKTKQP